MLVLYLLSNENSFLNVIGIQSTLSRLNIQFKELGANRLRADNSEQNKLKRDPLEQRPKFENSVSLMDGWMSFGFTSLQQYFSHFETMEG